MPSALRFRVAPTRLVGTGRGGPSRGLGAELGLAGGGATWLGNKPANYTVLLGDFDCSENLPAGTIGSERAVGSTGWNVIYDRDNGGGVSAISRQSDATAPHSPPYVWQWHQPAGDYGTLGGGQGTGFGNLFAFVPGSTTKIYSCFTMKVSAGYYVHPISNKLYECFTPNANTMVQLGHYGVYFEGYDTLTDYVFPHLINSAPAEETWFQVEVLFEMGNPGVLRVWIDDELRTDVTDHSVSAGEGTFETVGLYMHMGGGGFDLAADQYVWIDHITAYTD